MHLKARLAKIDDDYLTDVRHFPEFEVAKVMFPKEFVNILESSLGKTRASELLENLAGEKEVSVRVNPFKMSLDALRSHFGELYREPVEWARDEAFYLKERPIFTLDPLFHTGAYYVQEASSMYVGSLFRRAKSLLDTETPLQVLDLCAAPGGKTTHILSCLGAEDFLVANEVMNSRVSILSENVAKWGCGNVTVTSGDAKAFPRGTFDIVLADVPCSGEGMFRKDDKAVENWSLNNVKLCASRQKRIISDIWGALADGGWMIYSTCTFNRFEDEDNVEWICSELGAECLEMRHFYPGEEKGEGFFAALIRKDGGYRGHKKLDLGRVHEYQTQFPEADKALSLSLDRSEYPVVELNREDALKFLSKEPLLFPDQPLGLILLTYKDLALGFVKNLGRRSNNLHPMPRRIKNLVSVK